MTEFDSGLFDNNFGWASFDYVFRYQYDPSLAQYGAVKTTYKQRLSTKGTSTEAEWLPIETIERASVLSNLTPAMSITPLCIGEGVGIVGQGV